LIQILAQEQPDFLDWFKVQVLQIHAVVTCQPLIVNWCWCSQPVVVYLLPWLHLLSWQNCT